MLRPTLVIMAALLVLATTCGVQSAAALRYEGTVVKAGGVFNFSGYRFTSAERIDGTTQVGVSGGVSTLWRLSRRSVWVFVFGADYVQKGYSGARLLPGVDDEITDVDVFSDWISVPVLGRIHFVEDKLTAYAIFGPSLEFRISHDDDALLDEGKDFALAATVGIGMEYELGRTTALQLEGRYFTDLTDSWDGGDLYTVQGHRHHGVLVTGGLRF